MTAGLYEVVRQRRIRLNTKNHHCVKDPEYSVVKCLEQYSTRQAGCSSPWNLHPSLER